MLRAFASIGDALERSTSCEFPLLVIITATLPNTSHMHALEAARSTARFSFLPGFLPQSSAEDISLNPAAASGRVNALVDPFDAENAELGVLRDEHTQKLNADFKLGRIKGGPAQKEAISIVLLQARLGNACFIHWIEDGTEACEQFCAVGGSQSNPNTSVPRVHVFPPASRGWQSIVLSGDLLTPMNIKKSISSAMQLMPAALPQLMPQFLETVGAMNREGQRTARAEREAQQSLSAPVLPSATAAPPSNESSAADVRPTPPPPAGMHLIHVEGLPLGKKKTILATPSSTLRTVMTEVRNVLRKLSEETAEAKAAGEWSGVTHPGPDARITLTVNDGRGVSVSTPEEAEKVKLQGFPSGTVVHVHLPTTTSLLPPVASAKESKTGSPTEVNSPKRQQQQQQGDSEGQTIVVCDGDTCRRVPAPPPAASAERDSALPSPTSPSRKIEAISTSITLRLSLPDGRTEMVKDLDPTSATLQKAVRPVAAQLLSTDQFYLARPYPPKRFDASTDEQKPLCEVGLTTSSALRVILLDASSGGRSAADSSSNTNNSHREREVLPSQVASSSGILHQLSRLIMSRPGGQADNNAGGGNRLAQTARAPPRREGNVATLASLHGAAEDDLRTGSGGRGPEGTPAPDEAGMRAWMERVKKSNRYYGGDSTEYVGKDRESGDDDDNDENDDEADTGNANSGGGGGGRFFTGEGRRLAGAGGKDAPSADDKGKQSEDKE